jgi:hypothetical protein
MSNQKKKLEITGYLLYPIKIGEYAWIQEQNGVRRTTPVVRMERFTSSEVRFETRNTLYHLHLVPYGKEVCAVCV